MKRRNFLLALAIIPSLAKAYCKKPHRGASGEIEGWMRFLDEVKNLSRKEKVQAVNLKVNDAITYVDDEINHGVDDYWMTPTELLNSRRGDCEDYAILKYVSLLHVGVEPSLIRLSWGYANTDWPLGNYPVSHMVATVLNTEGEPWILDNSSSLVLPYNKRPDLDLKVSFNNLGAWHVFSNNTVDITTAIFYKKFRRVCLSAKEEGFLNVWDR